MSETEKTEKPAKAPKIEPDAYDLSAAVIERRIVRDGGSVELRVVVPLPADE